MTMSIINWNKISEKNLRKVLNNHGFEFKSDKTKGYRILIGQQQIFHTQFLKELQMFVRSIYIRNITAKDLRKDKNGKL